MIKHASLYAAILTAGYFTSSPAQPGDPHVFWQGQMEALSNALSDPQTNARVRGIWFDLQEDTGEMYPVLPAQQFTMGQALPNGVVLLDLSIAGDEHIEVTAFWLAHEYAHQVYNHPQMQLTRVGQMIAATAGTRLEDDADEWAARFLSRAGYEIATVLDFLCSLPDTGGVDQAHSPGPERARNVARAYGLNGYNGCESPVPRGDDRHLIKVRIWSLMEGDPSSLDFVLNGQYVGRLDNRHEAEILELGELEERTHTFSIKDVTVYNQYGQPWNTGASCSDFFNVMEHRTFQLWFRITPTGDVQCGLQ